MKRKSFKVPKWMLAYKDHVCDFGRAVEFMNCDGVNCNIQVNAPRALCCCSVQSQVGLLIRLHASGLLR